MPVLPIHAYHYTPIIHTYHTHLPYTPTQYTLARIPHHHRRLGKLPADLRIYDPFYCEGAVIRHLSSLGFKNVYNRCEDFYAVAAAGKTPEFDVVVTNPPFSGRCFQVGVLRSVCDMSRTLTAAVLKCTAV